MTNAVIVGAFEHPTRNAPDKSSFQLHAEVIKGALSDAGLGHEDVDGFFCAGDSMGLGNLSLIEYLGLQPRHIDSTDTGGSAPLIQLSHAAQAIATGQCKIAVISLAGRARNRAFPPVAPGRTGTRIRNSLLRAVSRAVCARGAPPYARVRHDIGATGVDQGGCVAARAAQSAGLAAETWLPWMRLSTRR